jgi:POT family proton-dependent oligopeptide transporter
MVGGLYPQGDIRRDKGFSIFYIGINTGSLLATMVIGFVVVKWGWHAGFGLAGIAML